MNKSIYWIYCLVFLFMSCKTISLHQESQTTTTQQLSLGSIGSDKDFILQKAFNNTALPTYKVPVKVSVIKVPFNKSTYKSFLKAKASQSSEVNIKYIDSLKNKPHYLQLQIADKVALIHALNTKENSDVKNYLSHNANANIITALSIALNTEDMEAITNADAVFLIGKTPKVYVLQLYRENKQVEIILFTQGVVIGYKASNCCWQENSKRQLNIVDLVGRYSDCPNSTYRNSKRAKKKINYSKF